MPPPREVPVSIKSVQLDGSTKLFQCYCSAYLRFEAEYGLKRGTTSNAYLLLDGTEGVLVDVPRKEYQEVFCKEIAKETCTISTIVVTHLNPDIATTLAEVVKVINRPSEMPLKLVMSNPAKAVLADKLAGSDIINDSSEFEISVPGSKAELMIGRRTLQCIPATTPRYPELLCLYERTTRRLFSSCFFSAHVNPQKGATGTDGVDRGGWQVYGSDWRFFFDCMFAPVVPQASKALARLDIAPASGAASAPPLLAALKSFLSGGKSKPQALPSRPVASIMPRHGPVIREGVTQLVNGYNEWIAEEQDKLANAKVAVLYASAYGNTASLAQAISRGITKAGVGVEMVNLEQVSLKEAEATLRSSQGFTIGAPTLGGHMPTQVSAMLGSILRTEDAKLIPCGAYGSFGWSGEAVDKLHSSLANAGFNMAFDPIKVQFRPTAKDLQVCEESGTDVAQAILKTKRVEAKSSAARSNNMQSMSVSGAEAAMGRVVGSLSVITVKTGDGEEEQEAESAMLASWLSQASFDPPGLTIAIKRDRASESLMVTGNPFNVNLLKKGEEGPVMKALLKKFAPGEDRFGGVEHRRTDNGCVALEAGVAVLQCKVTQRMDAGDHFIVYGEVQEGEVLDSKALSAVHHRKAGNSY